MLVGHLLLRGNFYARIDPPLPQVDQNYPSLVPLNPDRMQPPKQNRYKRLTYRYIYQDGQPQEFQQEDILHVKLLTLDGFTGVSPLAYARETLGLATAQTSYASSIFSGGGFLKYYLKTAKRLGAEGRKNFRDGWRDLHGDPKHFEPPILEDDMSIQTLGMNNEDAQFLESRKFSAYELCQFMGVPPHLVFLLDRSTNNNIEHQGIEFLVIHLNPYLVRIEQCLQPLFGETHFAEFLRDAVVRGDLASRYTAYNTGIQAGFLTRNEVRAQGEHGPAAGRRRVALAAEHGTRGRARPAGPAAGREEPNRPPTDDEEDQEDETQAAAAGQPPILADYDQTATVQVVTLATQDEPPEIVLTSTVVAGDDPQQEPGPLTVTFTGDADEVARFVREFGNQRPDTTGPGAEPAPLEETEAKAAVDLSPIADDVAKRIVAREIVALTGRLEAATKVGENIRSSGLTSAEAYFSGPSSGSSDIANTWRRPWLRC